MAKNPVYYVVGVFTALADGLLYVPFVCDDFYGWVPRNT